MSEKKTSLFRKDGSGESQNEASGAHEMPSVTRLLNRRKLTGSEGGHPSVETPPSASPPPARVKVAARNTDRRGAQRLEVLTTDALQAGAEPEIRAIGLLLTAGAEWALVLVRESLAAEHYRAKLVAGGTRERWNLWTGMAWSESAFPEFWREFQNLDEVVLRADHSPHVGCLRSLGSPATEQVWAYRVGPRNACRAILLVGASARSNAEKVSEQVVHLLSR